MEPVGGLESVGDGHLDVQQYHVGLEAGHLFMQARGFGQPTHAPHTPLPPVVHRELGLVPFDEHGVVIHIQKGDTIPGLRTLSGFRAARGLDARRAW